jgi:hypothetical protein
MEEQRQADVKIAVDRKPELYTEVALTCRIPTELRIEAVREPP